MVVHTWSYESGAMEHVVQALRTNRSRALGLALLLEI
jgi:hypothetical protein